MKKFTKLSFLLFIATLLLSSKCKRDPEPFQNPELEINFLFKFDEQILNSNQWYKNAANNPIRFQTIRFFATNFQLIQEDDTKLPTQKRIVVDAFKPNNKQLLIKNLQPGNYKGLSFLVGVDSTLNKADPASFPEFDPLSTLNSADMHWDWNTGYIFFKAEGRYVNNSSDTLAFSMHIGLNQLLNKITLNKSFALSNNKNSIDIVIQMDEFFNSPNVINLNQRDFTHSMNDLQFASLIAANIQSLFKIN